MADTKISLLPAATIPLAGTEQIPVVQGGATRRVPASQFATAAQGALAGTAVQPADLVPYLSEAEAAAQYQAIGSAQPSLVPVRNTSGASLAAGTVTRITGSTGTRPTVAAADASEEATAAQTLGLLTTALANNADGMAITHGILGGISTAGLTEGAAVWLSETTGQVTSTRPTQPAHGVFLGFCVKASAGAAGILYVNVINGQELNELHDVLITGAAPAPGARRPALVRQSSGLWADVLLDPSDVGAQPLDSDLTAIAALSTTAYGRALLALADAAAARSALALGTAATTAATDYATAAHTQTASTISDSTIAGRALLTAADAAAQRSALGLGAAATLGVGTTAGTVAAGDDSRITGALSAATAAATYQPLDSDLTAIAALSTTAYGRAFLALADAAAARSAIGAGTSNVVVSSSAPAALGASASAGNSADAARADHIHARSTYADLGAIGDGLVLVISDKGQTATAGTNFLEWPVPVPSGSFTLTAVRFGSHIDATGSSSSTFNAYRRTAAGVKTSVLTGNATLASAASLVDASASITGGTFAAGDRIGVDLIGVGTGASGLFAQFLFTRSAT